mmetsp:Transcript_32498/g.75108  ORF Transcript_32498/g.75108 Transcript_32498/m.75108 type:complete len:539 (-) Transcript_32498:54-1670(-)
MHVSRFREGGLFRASSVRTLLTCILWDSCRDDGSVTSTFNSLPAVDKVEFFISHSWSAPSWLKFFSMCHFLNLQLAVLAAVLTWITTALALILHAGSITVLSGSAGAEKMLLLQGWLVFWPMAVFFLVYFLGHFCRSGTYWMDKVCVNQPDAAMKARAIEALPEFIKNSSNMIVLWDDTYFERLFCNYEMAVFATNPDSIKSMHFIPIWLPVWILCTLVIDLAAVSVVSMLFVQNSDDSMETVERKFGTHSIVGGFLVNFISWFLPDGLYLFAAFPVSLFHVQKIRQHGQMLEQMSRFDIRRAKCASASDRTKIEEHVYNLFKDTSGSEWERKAATESAGLLGSMASRVQWRALESPEATNSTREAVFDAFHAHVRGPLRDSLLRSIGAETDISWTMCSITFLPFTFCSLVSVLGCDGNLCWDSARREGFRSVPQYMLTNAVSWFISQALCVPTIHPWLLRMLKHVLPGSDMPMFQAALATLCGFFVYFAVFFVSSSVLALLAVGVTAGSRLCFGAFVGATALLAWQTWFLFGRKKRP